MAKHETGGLHAFSFAYVNMAKQDQLKKKGIRRLNYDLNLQSHLVSTLYSRAHQASCAPCALPQPQPRTAAPIIRLIVCTVVARNHMHITYLLCLQPAALQPRPHNAEHLLRPHFLARWHTRPAHTAAATAIPAHVSATAPIAIATATIATPAIAIAPATLTAPPGPHDRWPRPGVSPPKPERHADHAQPTGGCLAKHRAR